MPIAALVTWIITALIGSFMLIRWVSRGGLRPEGGAVATHFPPARVFTHFGLAAGGLVLWIGFLVTGTSDRGLDRIRCAGPGRLAGRSPGEAMGEGRARCDARRGSSERGRAG